jgi:hypothetical protein
MVIWVPAGPWCSWWTYYCPNRPSLRPSIDLQSVRGRPQDDPVSIPGPLPRVHVGCGTAFDHPSGVAAAKCCGGEIACCHPRCASWCQPWFPSGVVEFCKQGRTLPRAGPRSRPSVPLLHNLASRLVSMHVEWKVNRRKRRSKRSLQGLCTRAPTGSGL